jgi:hypothetical protein
LVAEKACSISAVHWICSLALSGSRSSSYRPAG